MDALEKKALLTPGTRRALLSNSLVIVVRRDSRLVPHSAADLTLPAYRKLALAEPHTVPAGIYAREYLMKLKIWDALESRIVPTERQATPMVLDTVVLSVRWAKYATNSSNGRVNGDVGSAHGTSSVVTPHSAQSTRRMP